LRNIPAVAVLLRCVPLNLPMLLDCNADLQ
jgi:hypothetical protein